MRFAILCAVSTLAQATPDKISLAHQEETCRKTGLSKSWTEAAGPYLIPGKSRSNWVNLRDAEEAIPELHEMLEAAKQGTFDVLMMYDYNRLRDLLDVTARTLATYGVQVYSVNQPSEPLLPDQFNPYASDTEPMIRGMSQIISRWSINDLRRKYKVGMPARIQKGLTPLRVPFAYKWVGKKEPPQLEPQKAALVLQMKELFMQGRSLTSIAQFADHSGVPTPNGGNRWDISSIEYILANPHYAGLVTLHKSVQVRDPRRKNQKRQVEQARNKWTTGKGQHESLWDEPTHHAILRELDRRYKTNGNNILATTN